MKESDPERVPAQNKRRQGTSTVSSLSSMIHFFVRFMCNRTSATDVIVAGGANEEAVRNQVDSIKFEERERETFATEVSSK